MPKFCSGFQLSFVFISQSLPFHSWKQVSALWREALSAKAYIFLSSRVLLLKVKASFFQISANLLKVNTVSLFLSGCSLPIFSYSDLTPRMSKYSQEKLQCASPLYRILSALPAISYCPTTNFLCILPRFLWNSEQDRWFTISKSGTAAWKEVLLLSSQFSQHCWVIFS